MFDGYEIGQKIPVLDHGYVVLRGIMGDDTEVADAARISYDAQERPASEDEHLIRYLYRHKHTSPFEMCELKFELKMPIFVARQWVRHRTVSMNEVSARYTQLPEEMFVPHPLDIAKQSTLNKQGRGPERDFSPAGAGAIRKDIKKVNREAYATYTDLLEEYDLARELARVVLPLSTYTKFVWKVDLHNLLHFLKLRTDKHAQKEIRAYAEVIETFVATHFPICHQAWVDYSKEAVNLSRMEFKIVQDLLRFYMYQQKGMTPEGAQTRLDQIDEYAGTVLSKREVKEFRGEVHWVVLSSGATAPSPSTEASSSVTSSRVSACASCA